ncbi:hypothetical protein D3C79_974940 [compost metagenome]
MPKRAPTKRPLRISRRSIIGRVWLRSTMMNSPNRNALISNRARVWALSQPTWLASIMAQIK